MPGAHAGRHQSREQARALLRASRDLQVHVADLAGELPFARPPTLAEVQQALPGDDLRCLRVPQPDGSALGLAYIETLIDGRRLWDEVVKPIVSGTLRPEALPRAQPIPNLHVLVHRLLLGSVVLLPPAGPPLALDLKGLQQRAVGEPTTEQEVVGPKEAFVENLQTNVGLIRNRLRDPGLRVQYHTVGRRSRTRVAMLYLSDVARPETASTT